MIMSKRLRIICLDVKKSVQLLLILSYSNCIEFVSKEIKAHELYSGLACIGIGGKCGGV